MRSREIVVCDLHVRTGSVVGYIVLAVVSPFSVVQMKIMSTDFFDIV